MYDEDIKLEADATALAQLIISIAQSANKSETDEKIDALQTKIESLENQIDQFDVADHSYEIGEIALEHLTTYGGLQETVVEIIDDHDFSEAEIPVASGTTFTVTVD